MNPNINLGYMEDARSNTVQELEDTLRLTLQRGPDCALAILIIELERFRTSTDSLAYSFGEEILGLSGQRIASAIREQDRLMRLSSDQFVLLVDSTSQGGEGELLAKRLVDLLERPYAMRGQVVNVGVCIGMALAPENGAHAEVLLHRAAIALRCAKTLGQRTFHIFDIALEQRMQARYLLAEDLRKALLLHQFEVHYQPQVNLSTRQLVGFEALLRWRHPAHRWVSPGDFIPIAEEIGLIGPIGDWVLRTACKQAALLSDGMVVAVNASPVQLQEGLLMDSVHRALSATGLPANRLEIEVTEGVLLHHTESVLNTLHGLRAMGVRLAIDDFGTGYSSLGQLARLPFHTIKIDRSLVGTSPHQRAIVRSIVTLADGLGMCVLAEGLETEEEYDHAASAGCQLGQGYLFGKAVPPSQLAELIAQQSQDEVAPL